MMGSVSPAATAAIARAALDAALASEGLMRAVTALPTCEEAVAAVLACAGMRAYTTHAEVNNGYAQRTAFICAIVAGDEVGECTVGNQQNERWAASETPEPNVNVGDLFPSMAGGVRTMLVRSKARAVASGNMSAAEVLAAPLDDDGVASVAFRTAVLGAWWEARLAQGHSPASARMLLNLATHPSVLSRLRSEHPDAPFFRGA